MHRCLVWLSIANIAIGICCGCSCSSQSAVEDRAARIAVTHVSVPQPPGPKLVQGIAKVSNTAEEEIAFTLILPPNWKWIDGQAEKSVGPESTAVVLLTARLLPDDERAESSSSAARRRLLELAEQYDFVIPTARLDRNAVRLFCEILADRGVRAELARMGFYA